MSPLHKPRFHGRCLVILGAGLAFAALSSAQSEQVIRFDGGRDDRAHALTTDAAGAIIVAGASTSTTFPISFVVVKFNALGGQQWMARYAGAAGQLAGAASTIVTDSTGNIYAAGYIARQVTPTTWNIDWLVVSFDPHGAQRWAHVYNSPGDGYDQASEMVLDPAGALYVTGHSGVGNNLDWLTTKYTLDGGVIWQRGHAGAAAALDQPVAMKRVAEGGVVILGSTSNLGVGLARDVTLVSYAAAGHSRWIRNFSDTTVSDEFPGGLAIDSSDAAFVTGITVETSAPESEHHPFTLKYDRAGNLQFVTKRETAGGFSVAIGPDGNPVVAGTAVGEVGSFVRPSVSKIHAATGAQLWSTPLEAEGEVAVDSGGSVYVGGFRFLGAAGSFDYFATRLSVGGQQTWQRIVLAGDVATDAHLDASGNFFVTGSGPGERDDMVTVRFSAGSAPPPPPVVLPAGPSNLGLTAAKGRLTLQWTDHASNESGFRIERAINGGGFTPIAQVGANVTTLADTGLNKKNTYAYRVRAFNANGDSGYSNAASGRPK